MPKIDRTQWYHIGQYINPPISCSPWNNWTSSKALFKIIHKKLNPNTVALNGEYYIWQDNYDYFHQLGYETMKNYNLKFFQNFFKILQSVNENLLKTSEKMQAKNKLSATEIKLFYRENIELTGPWMMFSLFDKGMEEGLAAAAQKCGRSLNDLVPYFEPQGQLWLFDQNQEVISFYQTLKRRKLLSLLKNPETFSRRLALRDPKLLKKIKKHVQKFEWFGWHHFWGAPFTLKKLILEIKEQDHKQRNKTRSKKRIPEALLKRIKIANQLTYWRSRCAEISAYSSFYLRRQFVASTKDLGIKNYSQFIWFTFPEIIDHLQKNRHFNLKTIIQRRKNYGLYNLKHQEKSLTGAALKKFHQQFKIIIDKKITKVKGVVANPGLAKGRVHIITEPKHVPSFKAGEILVAPETTPNFVPAMKSAAAIVTNHGGITSHAAIVSRELHKPCVIATKIATEIFKNGDLIEVDAYQGIVKKL